VQIKRFQSKKAANTGRSGFFNLAYAQICQQEKIDEHVDFPVEGLDIQPFVKQDCAKTGVSSVYDLYAVTNHFGSLNGGHYTAYAKGIDSKWYDFNDSSVGESRSSRVCSPAAYLLFYRRRPDPSPSQSKATAKKS
jgi:ubiquitin C-terminal hydrolase